MADLKISQLPAATVPLTGTEIIPLDQGGTTVGALLSSTAYFRQPIASRSFYVNASSSPAVGGSSGSLSFGGGDDTTGTGTLAAPWLTLQHAYNWIVGHIDFGSGNSTTIFLAHGSSTNYALSATLGSWLGTSVIGIVGDSADQTQVTVQAPTGGYGLQFKDLACINYSYLTFADNGSTNGAGHIIGGVGNYGHLDIANCTFKSINTSVMVTMNYGASMSATGPLTINGSAGIAFEAVNGGMVDFGAQTVTVTGTPAFSVCFAYMVNDGVINATSSTFSGSATGPRCIIDAPIAVGGYAPNAVFPGNADGVQNAYVGAVGLQSGSGGSEVFAYGTAGQPLVSGGSSSAKNTWGAITGSGSFVKATSPTLVTPVLGTPTSGTLTNCTGLPMAGIAGSVAPTSWTPTDQSGATLTFTAVSAFYQQIGSIVTAWGTLTYPSTANGSNAVISLPVAVPNQNYAVLKGPPIDSPTITNIILETVKNTSTASILAVNTNVALVNSTLSLAVVNFIISYPAV